MKLICTILVSTLLTACSYSYPIKEGGDGVYYAESPPVYTYVDGFFGFPYYGPYSWTWYHPVWYSPLYSHHYSWFRRTPYYGVPYYMPSYAYTGSHEPRKKKKGKTKAPVPTTPGLQPLLPVDLQQVTISPSPYAAASKNPTFSSASARSRYAAKYGRSAYSAKYGSMNPSRSASSYRPSASSRSMPSTRSSATSGRSTTSRHVPSRMVVEDKP